MKLFENMPCEKVRIFEDIREKSWELEGMSFEFSHFTGIRCNELFLLLLL